MEEQQATRNVSQAKIVTRELFMNKLGRSLSSSILECAMYIPIHDMCCLCAQVQGVANGVRTVVDERSVSTCILTKCDS